MDRTLAMLTLTAVLGCNSAHRYELPKMQISKGITRSAATEHQKVEASTSKTEDKARQAIEAYARLLRDYQDQLEPLSGPLSIDSEKMSRSLSQMDTLLIKHRGAPRAFAKEASESYYIKGGIGCINNDLAKVNRSVKVTTAIQTKCKEASSKHQKLMDQLVADAVSHQKFEKSLENKAIQLDQLKIDIHRIELNSNERVRYKELTSRLKDKAITLPELIEYGDLRAKIITKVYAKRILLSSNSADHEFIMDTLESAKRSATRLVLLRQQVQDQKIELDNQIIALDGSLSIYETQKSRLNFHKKSIVKFRSAIHTIKIGGYASNAATRARRVAEETFSKAKSKDRQLETELKTQVERSRARAEMLEHYRNQP